MINFLKHSVIAVALWSAAAGGWSQEQTYVPKLGSGAPFLEDQEDLFSNKYQIGDEWAKVPVTATEVRAMPAMTNIAYGTAHVNGATGFYLGKFAGKHIVATNHHVCSGSNGCRGSVSFPLINKKFQIDTYYGSWTNIDLALFSIKVAAGDEPLLMRYANPFAFDLPLKKGQMLLTVGFGLAENSSKQLVGNWDSDCKVFSNEGEYRFMSDPDELNPGDYSAWSFASGCDVSHGDSGSAMVDRSSGRVIGILWTGKIPKNPKVQSSAYLDELLQNGGPAIWSELTYAVPAVKIKEQLNNLMTSGQVNGELSAVLQAMVTE